jgi:hypothetical protein
LRFHRVAGLQRESRSNSARNYLCKGPKQQQQALGDLPVYYLSSAWRSNGSSVGKNVDHWTDKIVSPRFEPQNQTEEVLGKFGANRCRGIETVGGRIIITNQRLLFESHRLNLQKKARSNSSRRDRLEWRCAARSGLFRMARCHSGERYQFVLWDRKKVIDLIKQQRPNIRF